MHLKMELSISSCDATSRRVKTNTKIFDLYKISDKFSPDCIVKIIQLVADSFTQCHVGFSPLNKARESI